MKKLLLMLFALLTTAGAGAQVVTDRDSAGDPMTFEQFKALAGTGKHFALMAPSSADLTYKKWFSFSKAGYPTTLTTVQLFDLENSASGDDWYNIKRVSDNLYVSTEGGNFDATTKMDFKLVNRRAGDYATEFEDAALHISLDNAAGNHYNCNTSNLGFRAGTGGYSTYIAYGPFYLVTVNCVDESDAPIQDPVTYIVKDGTTISKPEIYDYISVGESESVTVNGEDVVMTCHYKRDPSAVDWTPSIGSDTYLTIGEKVASISATDDPADNTKWYVLTQVRDGETPMYDVGTGSQLKRTATSITTSTINGTLTSSNTQYLIRFVSAGDGLYNIQFANGNWITENLTTSSSKGDAGNYAFYNTNGGEGSYFAWNLNSKEGKRVDNNGAGNTVAFWSTGEQSGTSGNSIWYIYETTIEVPSNVVKYVISDANEVVFTSDERPATVGETITALPSDLQRSFCSYSEINQTMVAGENTVNVTVTYSMPFEASTDYDNAKWYYATIRDTKYLRADDSQKDSNGRYTTSTTNEKTDVYKWAFFGNPYSYFYIANKGQGEGKYLNAGTVPTFETVADPASTNATLWEAIPNSNGFTLRSITGATMYINDASGAGNLGFWNNTNGRADAGGKWVVEEVPAAEIEVTFNVVVDGRTVATATELQGVGNAPVIPDVLKRDYTTYTFNVEEINASTTTIVATPVFNGPFVPSADFDNAKWYYLYGHSSYNGSGVYTDGDDIKWQQGVKANTDAYKWAFIGNPVEGFELINKATGASKLLQGTNPATMGETGTSWTLREQKTESYQKNGEGFGLWNDGLTYLNVRSGQGNLQYWSGFDQGSTYWVEEVPEDEALYNDIIAQLEAINWGTGLGQYSMIVEGSDDTAQATTIISGMKEQGYSEQNLTAAQLLLESAVLNMPEAGYYRIKGKTSGMYLAAGLASNNKFNMSSATDATTIFYFDGTTLVNFGSGMSNGMTADAWAWVVGTSASTVEFQDGLTNGGYAIKSATANFYDNGDGTASADRGGNITISTATNARYTSWALEEVSELPISLNAVGGEYYATLCVPFNVTLAGAEAYTLTVNADKTELDLGEALTEVPAGTPVLLKGSAATATATIGENYVNAPVESTLTGVFYATTVTAETDYFLGQKDGEVGFYKWTGTTLKANRAYLPASAVSADVKGLKLNFGDADAIEAIENGELTNDNGAIYNLAGQRVSKATKGIYIINGRKVVVK